MDEGTLKKEVRKIWGHAVGEGEFENRGQEPLKPQKGPKIFEKIFIGKV